MNHLHEVIDAIKRRSLTVQETIPRDSEPSLIHNFQRMLHEVVCFNAGDALEIASISGIAELVRLPFRVCWIEFNINGVIIGAMCESASGDSSLFHVMPFIRMCRQEWHMMDIMAVDSAVAAVKYITTPEMQEWYKTTGAVISRFLSALNCTNVKRIESKPSDSLNKAKLRRGKQPLFSTWTLSISIPRERRDHVALGGAHASPRVHLRRGHPREYKPGLWTWVQPCAVGAKENGMVHKEYRTTYGAERSG